MRFAFLRPALLTAAIVASAAILAGGLALRPAFAVGGSAMVGPFTVVHCTSTSPCQTYNNGGKGAGLQGTNANASTSGEGLLGVATRGGNGVTGQANTGTGVNGSSSTGLGVFGGSNSSIGVEGLSSSTIGVLGAASSGTVGVQGSNGSTSTAIRANGFGGPLFVGNNSSNVDVFTVDNAGNATILGGESVIGISGTDALDAGTSASLRGVVGSGTVGVEGFGDGQGPFAVGVAALNNASFGGEALSVQDITGTGVLITGFDNANTLKFEVADDGTVNAHAYLQTLDTPAGQKVTSYANQVSTPKIEDFGEAQLRAGQAYVGLERTFASTIDARFAYMVFITPEGDTRGLYVSQKTPAGFVVRENQGGRSTVAFSYRIVAKPYGSTAARLAPATQRYFAPPHQLPHLPTMSTQHRVPKSHTPG